MLPRLLLFCAFLQTLSGADISGIWSGQITDRNGDGQDVSFRFFQSGETLKGKMYGDNESTPISDAKLAGNQITFSVTIELNGSIAKLIYTGTVDGDNLALTRQRAGNASANSKDQKEVQIIRLRRVA